MNSPSFAPGSQARVLYDLARARAKTQPGYSSMEWNRLFTALDEVSTKEEYVADQYSKNRCGVCGVPWEEHNSISPKCPNSRKIPSSA